ncbi:MAG TPA: YeeE/YedE thiosulfate transporter family protein [Candidatus Baltobacteraceae bacterium]|nr:YeeE/YedE thiosulfate transporter family protein [Candidatus Baltobacteraceae bacterium]
MNTRYMNPYLAGVLLGLVLLLTIYLTGRGLGASGALKSVVVAGVQTAAPAHLGSSGFYREFAGSHEGSPLKQWLVFEVAGVLVGGFLSGVVSRRLTWVTEKGPRASSGLRIVMAAAGGALFGAGAQFARGCTSGAALSGMAVLSSAGFLTMLAIFGTGYMVAYIFRKLWI